MFALAAPVLSLSWTVAREVFEVANNANGGFGGLFAKPLPVEPASNRHVCFTRLEHPATPQGPAAFEGLEGLEEVIAQLLLYRHLFDPDFIQRVSKTYPDIGRKTPFLIFSGPPGSGKSDVAKRTADCYGVPLLIVEAAHVCGDNGERAAVRLQRLRHEVKEVKSCVVLFDEIDHFIAEDSKDPQAPSIRSQFRQLVDGFDEELRGCNVLFVGTTNRVSVIERDMVSRAEVLHFEYPAASAMGRIVSSRAHHLSEREAAYLGRRASALGLGPRDLHECALKAEVMGASGKALGCREYLNLYQKKAEDYKLLCGYVPPETASWSWRCTVL